MTPFEKFLESLTLNWKVDAEMLGKAGILLFLGLYLIFSLVVVKQVKLMSATINGLMEDKLVVAAYGLMVLAALSLILAIVVL